MSHLVHRLSRPWRATLLAIVAALAVPAVAATAAQAKVVALTGTTTITPTAQTTAFLSSNGVTVATTRPATPAAGGGFSLPVVAGVGRTQDFTGVLVHAGGLRFTKGGRSLVVRRLVAVRSRQHAVVLAQVPGLRGGCARVASALRRFAATHPRFVRRHAGAARRVVRAARATCAGGRIIVLARIAGAAKQVSGGSATLTADLRISPEFAGMVNRRLGTSVAAGTLLATASSAVTTG
jgi:hypothetical protein